MKFWQKRERGLRLLTALDIIRANPSSCDFEVRFNGQSFHAHRAVLMTSSDYFRGMLRSDMKESSQGFVDVKGLETTAVKDCLEYLYTGEILMEFDTIDATLRACDFLQIDEIKETCFRFLKESISVEKCFQILYYATIYQSKTTIDATMQFVITNYRRLIETDEFQKSDKVIAIELLRSVLTYPTKCLWRGITRWVDLTPERVSHVIDFLEEIPQLCVKSTLEAIIEHPLVVKNVEVKRYIVRKIFFNQWVEFKEHISNQNCLAAYQWAKDYRNDLKSLLFEGVVLDFMKANFSTVYQLKDFVIISKNDFEALLDAEETTSLCQTIRWRAITKWVGYDVVRATHFRSLLKFVNLEFLSADFINTRIRNHPLLQSSNEFKEQTINAVIYHKDKKLNINAYLLFDKTTGDLHRYYNDSWELMTSNEKFAGGILLQDKGDVYVLNFPSLYKIQKDGSIEVKESSPMQCVVKTAVIHLGKIFVFHNQQKHSIYRLAQGYWSTGYHEFTIPDGVASCSTEKGIIFLGGKKMETFTKFYHPQLTHAPPDTPPGTENGSSISLSGSTRVTIPDPPHDESRQSINPIEHGRFNASCASVGNTVLLVGGESENNYNCERTLPSEIYDIKSNSWSIIKPFIKSSVCCCDVNAGFLIVGYNKQGCFGQQSLFQMGYFSNWTSSSIENIPKFNTAQLAGYCWEEHAKERMPLVSFVTNTSHKANSINRRLLKLRRKKQNLF